LRTSSSGVARRRGARCGRAARHRGGDQALRVVVCGRSMMCSVVPVSRSCPAQHEDPVGHLRDDGEVVRHVDRRRVVFAHDAAESVQHLDLRRHVERRRRLVEDHEVGSVISAIAAISRCSWPPDTWCG
jgi:hypothetical protein